eukprot:15274195-Ditylum_brightwellii.AAC.1
MSKMLHTLQNKRETPHPSEIFQLPQNDPPRKGVLPAQTSFKGCRGIFDEMIYLFPKDNTILNTAANGEPSSAWGKVISISNTNKGTNYYELRYGKDLYPPEEMNKVAAK